MQQGGKEIKQKVLISGLSLLLTFSLAGCGGQQAQQEPQEPKQEVQQSGAISTEPPAEPLEVKQEVVPTATAVPSEADPAEEVADQQEDLTEEVQLFTDCNETVYATGTVNLRNGAGTSFEKVGSLNTGDSVTRTGIGTAEAEGWSRIQLSDGSIVYVSNKYISTTKPAPQQQQQQTSKPSGGTTTQQQQQPQQPSEPQGGGDSAADIEARKQAFLNGMNQMFEDNGYSTDGVDHLMTEEEFRAMQNAMGMYGG